MGNSAFVESFAVLTVCGMFALLVVANFIFQFYVGAKVHKDSSVWFLLALFRGTRTFIRGWMQADELDIRDTMWYWSGSLFLLICTFGAVFVMGALSQ